MINIDEIRNNLRFNADVRAYDVIDSTNLEAKRLLLSGVRSPALIVADAQTAGRGRLGRSFDSPRGAGVYMSLILKPAGDMVSVTTKTAIAVARAIEALTGIAPDIKWVNDLYVNGRKICGILAETVSNVPGVVIGVGVNMLKREFPDDIRNTAGALDTHEHRERMIAAIANEMHDIIELGGEYMHEYRRRSLVIGKRIAYTQNGATQAATALDIDDNGGLIVRLDNGDTRTLSTGEISLRLS